MLTALLIGAAGTAIGAMLGIWIRRTLAPLNYRRDVEQALPVPGRRWWIIWTSAISLGSVTGWLAATDSWTLAPVLLPLTVAGPALAAIDLDVMRVPNRFLGSVALFSSAGLASTFLTQVGTEAVIQGLIGGAAAGTSFWLLNLATKGGVGMGDVKLAALVGVTAGSVSLYAVWLGLLVGSLAALLWVKSRRRSGPLPYAPWLLLGTWVALLLIVR